MSSVPLQIWDSLALVWFALNWLGYTVFADWGSRRRRTLMAVTHDWRSQWLRKLLTRDMRMVDIQVVSAVIRSVVFFASTSLLILAGLAAVFGATDSVIRIVSTLPYTREVTQEWWELVLLILFAIFVYAFFKFTWAVRQFNHLAYLVGAAPDPADATTPQAQTFVEIASAVATMATKQFNRGLRAYYFGLAVLPWFIHPLFFAIATSGVVAVLYAREFHSGALKALRRIDEL